MVQRRRGENSAVVAINQKTQTRLRRGGGFGPNSGSRTARLKPQNQDCKKTRAVRGWQKTGNTTCGAALLRPALAARCGRLARVEQRCLCMFQTLQVVWAQRQKCVPTKPEQSQTGRWAKDRKKQNQQVYKRDQKTRQKSKAKNSARKTCSQRRWCAGTRTLCEAQGAPYKVQSAAW
jgi:hypothetical protein